MKPMGVACLGDDTAAAGVRLGDDRLQRRLGCSWAAAGADR
jgi:hypothetical protein